MIVRFGSPVSHKLNIALMLLLAVLIITMPDPNSLKTGGNREKTEEEDTAPSDDPVTFLRGNRIFALFTLSVIFIFLGHSTVNIYMPNVAAQFGLGTDFTGMLNSLAAGLELIPMMFYSRITKKISPLTLLYISAFFFTAKILTTTLAVNGTGLLIAQTMQMLAYALFTMASIYFANQAVRPHNRVMAQGMLTGAGEIGFTIGSLVGGVVLDHRTIRTLLWMAVAATVIGSVLMAVAVTQFKRKTA